MSGVEFTDVRPSCEGWALVMYCSWSVWTVGFKTEEEAQEHAMLALKDGLRALTDKGLKMARFRRYHPYLGTELW